MCPLKKHLHWVLLIFLTCAPLLGTNPNAGTMQPRGEPLGLGDNRGEKITDSESISANQLVDSNPIIDPEVLALIQGSWHAEEIPLTLEFAADSFLESAKLRLLHLAPALSIRQYSLTPRISFPISPELLTALWSEMIRLAGLSGIFLERETIPQWLDAARQINLDPTVWNVQGYKGDPYTSVALIDHGFDASQACFAGKDITWVDLAPTNWPVANDTVGHGTKVGAIAVGNGWNYTDDQGRTIMSLVTPHAFNGVTPSTEKLYYFVEFSVNVSRPGDLNLTGYWHTSTNSITMKNFSISGPNGGVVEFVDTPAQDTNYSVVHTVDEDSLGVYMVLTKFTVDADPTSYNVSLELRIPQLISENGYNFQGVAPNCKLVALRATITSECIDALNWIKANYRAYNITTVVLSFTLQDLSTTFVRLCNELVGLGIVVVAAAGNSGSGENYAGYGNKVWTGYQWVKYPGPASADKAITVGAVTQTNRVTDYSSQGGPAYPIYVGPTLVNGFSIKPDVLAPGGEFPFNGSSCHPLITPDANTAEGVGLEKIINDTSEAIGTSFSAPAVAGVAQLLIEALGGIQNWIFSESQVLAVKALICMTATETNLTRIGDFTNESVASPYSPSLDRGDKDIQEGYGRINPAAAIQAVTTSFDFSGSAPSAYLWGQNSGPMNATRCWATKVLLNQSYVYNFTLVNPGTGDFDLYLYQLTPSSTGDPVIYRRSTNAGMGINEIISDFAVPANGYYYLVIKAVGGEGTWTLYANRTLDIIPPSYCWLNQPASIPYLSKAVSFSTTATDGQTGIHYQELWGGTPGTGQLLASIAGNGTITWNTQNNFDGEYTISARVFDGNNNSLTSENGLHLFVDNTPPSRLQFLNLRRYERYGGIVRIWIDAWDALSGVTACVLANQEEGLVGTVTVAGSAPYLFLWQTDASMDNLYTLYVIATDRAGNQIQGGYLLIYIANEEILLFGGYYSIIMAGPVILIGYYLARYILIREGLTRALTFFQKMRKAAQARDWDKFKPRFKKSAQSRQKRNN